MVLKATLDNLDDLPEQVHEHYVLRDGRYHLETEGLRTQADVDRVTSALTKERTEHKTLKDRYAPLSTLGVEVDEIVTRVNKFPELEIASKGKIDETKLEEIVSGRLKTATAPMERELATLREGVTQRDGVIGQYQERDRINTIRSDIRGAAEKAGLLPTAIEDALDIGSRMFNIDETGRVVTTEGNGVTPGVDAAVWLTEMQNKRPHWWPASVGGGAGGGGKGNHGGVNPFSAEGWNLTQQMAVARENPARAEQLAKAAGTSVGGLRPQVRK
jgi:hypothetical protein